MMMMMSMVMINRNGSAEGPAPFWLHGGRLCYRCPSVLPEGA
jgi:hypothetical protein